MTEQARRLAYFHKFQQEILQRLRITQDPVSLTHDDRMGLVWAYLNIVSG
jgi:hypothetical protein